MSKVLRYTMTSLQVHSEMRRGFSFFSPSLSFVSYSSRECKVIIARLSFAILNNVFCLIQLTNSIIVNFLNLANKWLLLPGKGLSLLQD